MKMDEELRDVCIHVKIWVERRKTDIITKTNLYRSVDSDYYKLVASVNCKVGDWAAYKGTGTIEEVSKWGDKITKEAAERYFPEFKKVRWRN